MLVTSSIALSLLRAVPLFVPGGRSFVPACARRRAARKGPSRPSVVLSCRLASPLPGRALTAPSPARGSGRSGRRLLRVDAREGASLVENRPGDPGELVGERNGKHVVVQSFLGGFDPGFEAIALPTLDPDQHDPRGLHEQRAQVAIAAPGYLAEDRAVAGRYLLRHQSKPGAEVAAF